MTVALISLLPEASGKNGEVALPFGLPPVPANWFYPVLFALLLVLTIAFAAAHAQQVRAQKLAQRYVDSVSNGPNIAGMHPRELFDMLRLPSLNRVAPLAQSIRGPFQFYSDKANCPWYLKVVSVVYYVLLKLVSMAVYFGVPAYALWQTHGKLQPASYASRLIVLGSGIVAAVTLMQVFLSDVLYSAKVCKKMWSS
jgi:hypothetical protein